MVKQEEWDAIVVGSGMGGLVCAAYLAVSGRRVLVLEQHDVAGGNSHVFRRRRAYEFDVGVHYLGDCGPDGVLPAIFSGLGLDGRVTYREMDRGGFDRIALPGLTVDVPVGWEAYTGRLTRALPGEAEGLARFTGICAAVAGETRSMLLSGSELSVADLMARTPVSAQWGRRTLGELFDHCGLSPRARTVLAAQSPNYGMGPRQATVATHAAVTDHYLRGAYYPEGGGQVLAAALVEALEAHGGQLRTKSRVERILVEDGRATGVGMKDGDVHRAPLVVSNADYSRTVLDLVGEEHFGRRVVSRTRRAEMALPLATLYIALDTELPERPNANLWWYRDADIEGYYEQLAQERINPVPFLFVSFASLKDPDARAVCPPGHSNFQVMTLCPPSYDYWGVREGPAAGERYRRNQGYQERKAELTEAMLGAAEEALGPFRRHIVHLETATPITHERYTLATGGTPYGLARWGGPGSRPDTRTTIEGLHVVGTNTRYGTGITGSAVGGMACAAQILDRGLLAEVHRGARFGDPDLLPVRDADWDPLAVSRGAGRRGARGLARIG
ncbi:NAD(P)/FAD-dependent oxidoreductase [Streptomyces chilikensis]|uniref:NAD(P)/FAD-dependent oxidoreductase n=2 Tax=Streptomyces chilikensis TaxID=1194079 RepID=A0ABV3EKC2_9ACTN|nr:NAD(P)/FAD-dependent oxidoreductase [Streptomyces chilikensis]